MYGSKKTLLTVLITILSILLIAMIGVLVYFVVTNGSEKSASSETAEIAPPTLTITSCPDQVNSDNPYVTITGTLSSEASSCTLTINGETVASVSVPGTQVQWNKTYQLQSGETKTFQLEAKDSDNRITTMSKSVFCQPLQQQKQESKRQRAPITPGCTLVKKKSSGLNIREYPGTAYDIVDYIAGNDYTSTMTFTGNYRIDSEGYTWYEVIAPNGKHGYVRSDLVQTNTFID